jgi:enamine deaminase RidA (YjgF/YER057c/UK114 family)
VSSPRYKLSERCGERDAWYFLYFSQLGSYSVRPQAVAVVPPDATTFYIAGQNAVDGDGTLVGGDDIAAQTEKVMVNLKVALAAAGASVHELVMMTVLFIDGIDLTEAYPVAAAALAGAAPPVVAVRVAGLGVPGALLEVSAVAAVSQS